ncbi:stage 0 sporulation protein [Butyricicoccus sp. 1XD8-22]|nr:stage 0 sporulation protein [Butyricicoccus sp. 1XD8-22]
MATVIGVRFKKIGKIYYFDPRDTQVKPGQHVIVETARGTEYGECVQGTHEVSDDEIVQPLKRLVRIATRSDREIVESNELHAREAYRICRDKIAEHGLEMNLVTVECTFDLNKILFYFTADGRVDFRELVKDLASIFRTRIELRQIGVRDEAKMLGGLGICGRELCCTSYLDEFQPVSINMAKEQNLSLNPSKISGTCGRLMCCLKYEHEVYSELQKQTPKLDSLVETPEGRGTVVSTQMLRGTCRVLLEDGDDTPQQFACTDCAVLRSGKAKGRPVPGPQQAAALGAPEPVRQSPRRAPREKPEPPEGAEAAVDVFAEDALPGAEKPHRRRRRGGRRH